MILKLTKVIQQKKHIENIRKFGIISEHRKTFNPIKQFLKDGILQEASEINNQQC